MSANESSYILGNGLEGVIAFEKAASENETGSVKIIDIIVSSDEVTVDATGTQVKATITVTGVSADVEDGYITRANVTGLNTTKSTDVVLNITKQNSWTFDTQTNPPTVCISSGYYPESFSSQLTATAMSMSNKTISVAATGSRIATATAGYIHISGSNEATHTASITQAGWASISNKTATITANVNGDINLQAIDSNLQAGNIVNGITIFGITGTAGTIAPQVTLPETLENTNNATITSITGSTNQVQVQADVTITPSIEGSVQVIGGSAIVKLRVPKYTGATTVTPSTTETTIQIQNKMATNNITVTALPTYDNGYNIAASTIQPSTSIDLTSNFNIADDTQGYMTLNLTTQSKWCNNDTSIQAQLLNAYLDYQLPTEYPAGNLVEWSLENLTPSFSNPGVEYAIRMYWPIRGKIGVNNLGFTVPVYTGESDMTQIEGGDG